MTQQRLFFDIETAPLDTAQLERVMPEFSAKANLTDPKKIEADLADKKADWLDKAALKAITGKIIAFTYAWDDDAPVMVASLDNELSLIEVIKSKLNEAVSRGQFAYAWNGHGFDLLFICQRGAVHKLSLFHLFMDKKGGRYYWNENFVDPKLVWSNYSPDHTGTSLNTVAKTLGVGEKNGDGKDFAKLLETDPAKAELYAKNDILLLKAVVGAMGV